MINKRNDRCFFIRTSKKLTEDLITTLSICGFDHYHNRYVKRTLEEFIYSHPKVSAIHWDEVSQTEEILHIILRP